jgi:hypothetical protein
MTIKTAGLSIALAAVAISLTACKTDEKDSQPSFETRYETRYELDQNKWQDFRSKLSKDAETSEADLKKGLKMITDAYPLDPRAVREMPNAPNGEESAAIENYIVRLREVVGKLNEAVAQRDGRLKSLEAQVSEARRLCSATRSWWCRPGDPEFSTSCGPQQRSDTCAAADRFRAARTLIDSHVSHYQDLLRALEERLKRQDHQQDTPSASRAIEA